MGVWAEIKYALNSTLGTNTFKSLDKIISTSEASIKNAVSTSEASIKNEFDNHIGIIPSENIRNTFINIDSGNLNTSDSYVTIKSNINGTVNFKLYTKGNFRYKTNFYLTITRNGVTESQLYYTIPSGDETIIYENYVPINIQKNDNITLTYKFENTTKHEGLKMSLCYDVVLMPSNGVLEVI